MKGRVFISFYKDATGRTFQSEKTLGWIEQNKNNPEYKAKRKVWRKTWYNNHKEGIKKKNKESYRLKHPNCRHNDPVSRRFREFVKSFF